MPLFPLISQVGIQEMLKYHGVHELMDTASLEEHGKIQ